jgi:phage protein D
MRPIVQIGGLSLAANDRILEVEVTDEEGLKSDSLNITLDDRDQAIALPQEGARLTCSLGYVETGLVFKGVYTVDEIRAKAPPREIRISAKSADMQGKLKHKHHKGYENKTVGEVIKEVAGRHKLIPAVSSALANFKLDFLANTNESDLNLLTRLADEVDANFNIKNGRLIFSDRGSGLSISGLAMTPVLVLGPSGGNIANFGSIPGNVLDYDCQIVTRPRHGKGRKRGWDKDKASEYQEEIDSVTGDPKYTRPHQSFNPDRARREATRAARSQKRSRGQLQLTVVGDPHIVAESPLVVQFLRAGVDGVWRVKSVKHRWHGGQIAQSEIDCEKPNTDSKASVKNSQGQETVKSVTGDPDFTRPQFQNPNDNDPGVN